MSGQLFTCSACHGYFDEARNMCLGCGRDSRGQIVDGFWTCPNCSAGNTSDDCRICNTTKAAALKRLKKEVPRMPADTRTLRVALDKEDFLTFRHDRVDELFRVVYAPVSDNDTAPYNIMDGAEVIGACSIDFVRKLEQLMRLKLKCRDCGDQLICRGCASENAPSTGRE